MKTIAILAIGVWVGMDLSKSRAEKALKERQTDLHKQLDRFMREHLPTMDEADRVKEIQSIIK